MLFREVKSVYFQNHEKDSTESRWAGDAELFQLAQDGDSRRAFLHSNGNSSAIKCGKVLSSCKRLSIQ
jgi:hypothetical protein